MKISSLIRGISIGVFLLLALSCAGKRPVSESDGVYRMHRAFNARTQEVWAATLKTLPRMDYLVRFMDLELGIIRTTSRINMDPEAFISGPRFRLEITIEQISPDETRVWIQPYYGGNVVVEPEWYRDHGKDLAELEDEIFHGIRTYLGNKIE